MQRATAGSAVAPLEGMEAPSAVVEEEEEEEEDLDVDSVPDLPHLASLAKANASLTGGGVAVSRKSSDEPRRRSSVDANGKQGMSIVVSSGDKTDPKAALKELEKAEAADADTSFG